ncbi:MAG TPA: HIT family protein [Candidatus Limnocylindrales bacterium]|nr:HIT family protein [Candidatus Limnocylindrales bacterium]
MTDCIFCAIVDGSAPADLVAEDEHTVSFMDINPVNPGHILTVPRRHAADVWDLTEAESVNLMVATRRVCHQIRRALAPPGLDLFVANGEAGGQTVFHVHVHAIPRWPSDQWIDPWTPTPGDPADIANVAARLRSSATDA